jgi:death-on-curing protein
MIWRFLNVELVKAMQAELIDKYGGSHGLRDAGLLESAVLRAQNKVNYEPDVSVAAVAASLAWGLIKNHAFIDGNKRIGAAALFNFLRANGYKLTCSEREETEQVLRAAASEITEDIWTAWVESNVKAMVS